MVDLFYGIYRKITTYKAASLGLLIAIVIGLIAIISGIRFEDDITSLIPENDKTRRIQKVLKSITFTDKIVVNIRRDSTVGVDELTAYADAFLDSLQAENGDYIKNIQGKVAADDLPKALDLVQGNLPLFLDSEDYQNIAAKLNPDSIAEITEGNYRTLISPSGIIAKKTLLRDPLGLSFMALGKLRQLGLDEDFTLENGFLLDASKRNILLFITPTFSSNETIRNKPFSDALQTLANGLRPKYGDSISVEFYGAALVAVANAQQVRRDILFTAGIAMLLLLVILIMFYRKLALPFILFSPTLFGVLLSVAFLCLFRTKISAVSLGIGSILLGVTLDYALHVLTHIRGGMGMRELYREVAPAVMMSSLTTASAFLCLLFLESQALQDLGIFAAVSVLGASVFALLFIPQVYRPTGSELVRKTFLDRLAHHQLHKNRWALIGLASLGALSLFTYGEVTFNQDIRKLNYETKTLIEARERLEKLTDISSTSIYVSTYGQDLQQVLSQNDSIFLELNRLKEKDSILSFSSVGALVRADRTQREKFEKWDRFWDADRKSMVRELLVSSGEPYGFKPTTFDSFYALLDQEFRPLAPNDLAPIASFALDDYLVKDDNGYTVTSLIKVDSTNMSAIREHFADRSNTLLINRQQVNETFLGNLKNDFNRLIGYSLAVVLLILLLFYRSLSLTLVTSIPIFLTWFLTVGIMGLLGMEFNIFNIIICSFIFGLGVDYCIFVTNGLLTEYRTGLRVLPTHKVSILLSVITTIAGVGVLIFAKHPVLKAIASVSLIGILSAAFVSFTVQPQLFRLFIGGPDKRPITLRYLVHSLTSFAYFGLSGLILSAYAWIRLALDPQRYKKPNLGFHRVLSNVMGSVLYTNPFLKKEIRNPHGEDFRRPAMIIANHTSFLDILCIGMLHPKIIFLVNDWVYESPFFGYAARLAGAYPVSKGLEGGEAYLADKVAQGFSLAAFPEGTRATNNKIKRFHKGAFYLAEKFGLDILPLLIHGNSEGLSKGSFIIRDGKLTLELLPRIPPENKAYGATYTERAKGIGHYFRTEFRRLRRQLEDDRYWRRVLLENYRYKGNARYASVKEDLIIHGKAYQELLPYVGDQEVIAHLADDYGQLALLLVLDACERKVFAYLMDDEARAVLAHNFLSHRYGKLTVVDDAADGMVRGATTTIINIDPEHRVEGPPAIDPLTHTLILVKAGMGYWQKGIWPPGFTIQHQNDTFMVFQRA